MTWKEVLNSEATDVIVQSYGYTEGRVNSHYEPFKNKRSFKFRIMRFDDIQDGYLDHDWLFLTENEEDLDFEERDGKIYLDDPELFCNSEY